MGKAKISHRASGGNVLLMKRLVLVKSSWDSATEFMVSSHTGGSKHSREALPFHREGVSSGRQSGLLETEKWGA